MPRLPIALLIMELKTRQTAMQENPVGVDTISDQGYRNLIANLQDYETLINNAPSDNNVIWDLLAQTAKYFTTAEYLQILELSKKTMGLEPFDRLS